MVELASRPTLPHGYRVIRELGRGAAGSTVEAETPDGTRRVAVEELSLGAVDDWTQLEEVEREARVLRELDHDGIPDYVDHHRPSSDVPDAPFLLVQELARGKTIAGKLDEGWRPTEDEVRSIARQVLDGLAYLGSRSPPLVHRDVKPHNLPRQSSDLVVEPP